MRKQLHKMKSSKNMRVLLVGHLYPNYLEAKILNQPIVPIQTQRFGLALLDALRAGFGSIEVFSTAPLLDYPHSRLVFAPSAKWRIDNIIPATMVSFVNLLGFKHLTRFFATLTFVFQWALRNRKYERVIILHGVQSCQIWGIILGQALAKSITIPFLTDDLGISLSWEGSLLKKFRRLDFMLMTYGLRKVSGVIAMTQGLAEKLAPSHPALIIHTIQNYASEVVSNKFRNSNDASFTVVYAGRLSHNYGIDLLLETFKKANRPNWRLIITGWGEMENTVRHISANNQQVEYLGFIDSERITQLYRQADVFINPKLTSTSIASLTFPSKIVEYLSTGKPVVSTNLSIFDDGIRKHMIIAQFDTAEEIIRCLDEVSSWNDQQRESWRAETIRFVKQELSPVVQGTRIRGFIEKLRNIEVD